MLDIDIILTLHWHYITLNDWHYIPFYASYYLFIFQFPDIFRKFSAVDILFVVKSSCVVSDRCLNEVSAIPKYLSGLLGADTTALYTMIVVNYLLSTGPLAWLLEVGWIIPWWRND